VSKIEMGKTYVTRRRQAVKIYTVDGGGEFPVHGAIQYEDNWVVAQWTAEGVRADRFHIRNERPDLIEPTDKVEGEFWVGVHDDRLVLYETKKSVEHDHSPDRMALLHYTFSVDHGEGLS
jgi:hypothetical protein